MKFNRVYTVACLAASMLAGCTTTETSIEGEMEWRTPSVSGTPSCDCPTCWNVSPRRLVAHIGHDDLHGLDLDEFDAAVTLGLHSGATIRHLVPGSDFYVLPECNSSNGQIRRLVVELDTMDFYPPPFSKPAEYPISAIPPKQRQLLIDDLRKTDLATVAVGDTTVHLPWNERIPTSEVNLLDPMVAEQL